MPVTQPHRRAPLSGAIVTAALPVITLAGLGAGAGSANAAPQPEGKAPTHRNILESRGQVTAQVAAAKRSSHTVGVRDGDSVWKIAKRHGVDVGDVLRLNHLSASDTIHPGDRLVIRGQAKAAPAKKASSSSSTSSAHARTSARANGSSHTVRAGDTLSGIAHARGISLQALAKSSGLKPSSVIYPGQKIRLPGGASKASTGSSSSSSHTTRTSSQASSGGSTYTIKSGDTLSGIAHEHGVSVSALASANHVSSGSTIYEGKRITIPGSSKRDSSTSSTHQAVPRKFLHYTYSKQTHRDANSSHRTLSARSVPGAAKMESIVRATARKMGVDPDLAVAHARVESGMNARAVSPANAVGVMQVLPSTVDWMGQTLGRNLDPLDPYDNVTAGVAYIRYLQANASSRKAGIAGYYQGLGTVEKNGMKKDTKDYVKKVRANL